MNKHLLIAAPLGGALMLSTIASADTFTWQGNLMDGGSPADGIYDLKFRLFDAPAGPSQVGSELVLDDVIITAGQLTLDLDFGAGVFEGSDRWLELDIKADADGSYTTLAPRQPINPVPYAWHAQNVAASAVPFNYNGGDAVFTGGKVGIGVAPPTHPLDVIGGGPPFGNGNGFASPARAIRVRSTATFGVTIGVDATNLAGGKLWDFFSTGGNATEGCGKLILRNDTDGVSALTVTSEGVVGIGTLSPAEALHVNGNVLADSFLLNSVSPSGFTRDFMGNSANVGLWTDSPRLMFSARGPNVYDMVLAGGNVGIGDDNPVQKLHVAGNAYVSGSVGIGTSSPSYALDVRGNMRLGNEFVAEQDIYFRSANGIWQVGSNNEGNGSNTNQFYIYDDTTGGFDGYFLTVQRGSGFVGLGTPTPTAPVDVVMPNNKRLQMTTPGGHPGLTAWDASNNRIGDLWFDSGTTWVEVLGISGGADIVEGFDVSEETTLEPGTMVVIDPENPGALMQSTMSYDSKVAGVVSGANGVNPGIHLGQDGVLDGDTKVAMTGRVYVKCSTENGAIRPGDRLTTASLAGHAMRATDRQRSDGAVIGKAMTSLDDETGLVLVLVNLQ